MASADLKVRILPSNQPTDRITLDVGGTHISMAAADLTEMIIDRLMMRAAETSMTQTVRELLKAPRIGEMWKAEGGIYAGVVRGDEGQPDYHLVVAEPQLQSANWKDAGEFAQALWIEGFRDFALPKRKEQAVLFGNVPELFAKEWYWSSETHAGDAEYAWSQGFSYGGQSDSRKGLRLYARAVRRVPIE